MNKEFFMKVLHGVRAYDSYFVMKKDAIGVWGFSEIHKCTAAMRMIAYGAPDDTIDDYLHMEESTTIESMYRLC
jgi:hypothetical protein